MTVHKCKNLPLLVQEGLHLLVVHLDPPGAEIPQMLLSDKLFASSKKPMLGSHVYICIKRYKQHMQMLTICLWFS